MTHICVSELTIIDSDNGLSPDRCQSIIWTNAGILSIGPLRTNFSEILIETLTFSIKKMRSKVSSGKRRPFCLGLNVLMDYISFFWGCISYPLNNSFAVHFLSLVWVSNWKHIFHDFRMGTTGWDVISRSLLFGTTLEGWLVSTPRYSLNSKTL